MSRYLIIDGYNAISKIEVLEERKDVSLESARMFFISMLNDFMVQKKLFDRVFVVFDSKPPHQNLWCGGLGITRHSYGDVEAMFTGGGESADSVIVSLLRRAKSTDRISVSSDDNFVRNHAKAFGRDVISINELEEIIMLKKKVHRGRIEHKGLGADKVEEINLELKRLYGLE